MDPKNTLDGISSVVVLIALLAIWLLAFAISAASRGGMDAWHDVKRERQAHWDALVEAATPEQREVLVFVRSKVEHGACAAGRGDWGWSHLDRKQTRAAIIKHERDCLSVLRKEIQADNREEKIAVIDQVAASLR